MKKLLLIFGILFCGFAFSQPPPAVAMPNTNQEKLIDEFLVVSNYKQSIEEYSFTFLYSKMRKTINGKSVSVLDKKDLENIVQNFDFERFKKNSVYNAFSQVPENNLKAMIDFYKSINGNLNNRNDIFFINQVINNNLTSQLNQMAEEIIKKKGY